MHKASQHPDPATIVRMADGREETPQDTRKIVRHLLRGCPDCQKRLLRAIQPEVDPEEYEEILERMTAGLQAEGRKAP